MAGYGILLTRLIAFGALAISVLAGSYLSGEPGRERALVVALLLLIIASSALIPSGAVVQHVTVPPSVEVAGLVVFTLAAGALCILVPDGTATCLPFIAAWFTPRVPVVRVAEISLLGMNVAALWVFSLRIDAPWWAYPGLLAGVVAVYQAGLRSRDRVERTEFAELMLAREQALQSERQRAAATAERERIARDLHDVLAHTLSGLGITLQNAATLLQSDRVAQARTQVDRARALAVEGQAEARQALAALASGPESAPVPVDLAAAIDRAVRDHRAMMGGSVTLHLAERPVAPAAVSGAVLAVLRESLTNVVRHAPDAAIRIDLTAAPDGRLLTLFVADDVGVSAAPAGPGGLGLTGMRSRVSAVGGSLSAGPTATGWAVELSVPLQPTAESVQSEQSGQ